jgi:AcrR family transcriptional regulator
MSKVAANPTPGGPGSFRNRMHALLRESILDAATARASKVDWSQVRIADIAEDVGVSRQTIYNEFGSKDQLAGALFEREMAAYIVGVQEATADIVDLGDAIRASVTWILARARSNEMLQRTLRESRNRGGGSETLLPFITVNAHLVVVPARQALLDYFDSRWPSRDREHATRLMELVIRFVISLVVLPSDQSEEKMVDTIVDMVQHSL